MKDKTSWQNDKWFTSPWNFEEEVTSGYSFPGDIKIHDITLRDGEQQAGIVLNREEKVGIAKKLDEVGVHRIEAGMPAVSLQDEAARARSPKALYHDRRSASPVLKDADRRRHCRHYHEGDPRTGRGNHHY